MYINSPPTYSKNRIHDEQPGEGQSAKHAVFVEREPKPEFVAKSSATTIADKEIFGVSVVVMQKTGVFGKIVKHHKLCRLWILYIVVCGVIFTFCVGNFCFLNVVKRF